jgi:ATP-dependent Clp protease protease subunit
MMAETLARHSGQTVERIEQDIDRDYILRGEEAVAYGLVDRVITSRELVTVPPSPNGKAPH